MDFAFTQAQEELRERVMEFLGRELAGAPTGEEEFGTSSLALGFTRQFNRKLGQLGWIGYSWPREYGAGGGSVVEEMIIEEEMVCAGAPRTFSQAQDDVGPILGMFGTEEQRREHLPYICRGERIWSLGYSEPEAGSDLASLKTRAERDGDEFVINGVKRWTSRAHYADWVWLAVRTDPTAPKHKGISLLMVDLKSPGITMEPIWTMAGGRTNEVYFDNVRIPKSNMVGELNRGWYHIAVALDHHRSGIRWVMQYWPVYTRTLEFARMHRPLAKDPVVRQRIAEVTLEYEAARWLAYRVAWTRDQGRVPNIEASAAKYFGARLGRKTCDLAMDLLGLHGELMAGSPRVLFEGLIPPMWMDVARANFGAAGQEILSNIIARRNLGLPQGD